MATPWNRTETTFGPPNSNVSIRTQEYRLGWKNGDRVKPLSYEMHKSKTENFQSNLYVPGYLYGTNAGNGAGSAGQFFGSGGTPPYATNARNRAYAKFREDALGEQSQLGVTFAEWEQSLDSIGRLAAGLTKVITSLNKRGLERAVKTLRQARPGSRGKALKKLPKKVADTWLEFWFGYSATYGDITAACTVIEQDVPVGSAIGVSGATNDLKWFWGPSYGGYTETRYGNFIVKQGGDLRITNPNLFLLQQLGLANPVAIGWELIPFSFIADWAFGIGTFLGSFTDFLGVAVEKAYNTSFLRYTDTFRYEGAHMSGPTPKVVGICMLRSSGMITPLPTTTICGNLGKSTTRAASAVSLLTQQLYKLFG